MKLKQPNCETGVCAGFNCRIELSKLNHNATEMSPCLKCIETIVNLSLKKKFGNT
jgi:hypothetical protein